MKIIQKLVLVLLVIIFAFTLVIASFMYISNNQKQLTSLSNYENKQLIASKMVENKTERLQVVCNEYTAWDEMMEYCENPDPDFAEGNLDLINESYGTSFVLIYNKDFKHIQSYYDSTYFDNGFEIDESTLRELFKDTAFCHFFQFYDNQLLEVIGANVVSSAETGVRYSPSQGFLLLGKIWDSEYVEELQQATEADVDIQQQGASKVRDDDFLYITIPLFDRQNNALADLEFKFKDNSVAQQKTLTRLSYGLIVLALAVTLFFLVMIRQIVGKPLMLLSESLNTSDISPLDKLKHRKDEAGAISVMIQDFFVQKKELEQTYSLLESQKNEIEKLSIVASETENAVVIMQPNGTIEWVNEGFTRLSGFTLETLPSKNVFGWSNNEQIREIYEQCVIEQKAQVYQENNFTADGNRIWTQITLNPIIDPDSQQVVKLIAIGADIGLLKQYEQEILQKSEEIITQRDELQTQRNQMQVQNEHIRGSIRYALTIQQAILPQAEHVKKYFANFVIYRPKDIVSGDFYWFARLKGKESAPNTFFFAVVDCTGHGVPGAFMSLIGARILNELVLEKYIEEPAEILEEMNKAIKKALKQDKTDNQDGMDVCICKVEKNTNKEESWNLTFSGAKRPLFILQNNEITTIKGSRKTVGSKFFDRSEFTQKTMQLPSGSVIYMSSDGWIDQPNYERKKFGSKALIELLEKSSGLPFGEQKAFLDNSLDTFMKNADQRDDITLWGVKLS